MGRKDGGMMRVLPGRLAYVFERFPTFTQTFCYREVQELERQGIQPAIYSIRTPKDEPPQDYDATWGQRVVCLPGDDELTSGIKQLHAEKRIPRAMRKLLVNWPGTLDKHRVYAAAWLGPRLRQQGVTHVHVHFAGIAARTAYWLKKFYGIGYSITGHANDIFREDDPGLPVGLGDLIGGASLVATVSDFSVSRLRERFPSAASRIHRAYNGIDLGQWPCRSEEAASLSTTRILSVGRYIEKKGFSDLIAACALLRDEFPKLECRIIGEGPLESELRQQINALGFGGCVELAGPKSQGEIMRELAEARVFALPCVVERDGGMDNLPTVLIEAMACGIPCVSTLLAGVPEIIEDRVTGALVPQRQPALLAEAIRPYLRDPSLATKHGLAGRARAERLFALPATTRHLKHLLVAHASFWPGFQALRHDPSLLSTFLFRSPATYTT